MTSRKIHLVRHGRSAVEKDRPPHEWGLDPAGFPAISGLRDSGRLPGTARWFSSPEAKALETARRLTDTAVTVVDELREHVRRTTVWFDDPAEFKAVVRRAFELPDEPALEGWEPLSATRDRLLPVVRRILTDHPEDEIVLAGHGTAWTLLVAELTGRPPDLEAWSRLGMPDHWVVETAAG
jgi:broad specificity phosphatase PhoE